MAAEENIKSIDELANELGDLEAMGKGDENEKDEGEE